MQVEFLIENIEGFLPTLSKVIPIHSQIPVLSNLLLEATKSGFFINATNLELGVRIKIPAKITQVGSVTIPGKQFIEALSSLPKDKVQILFDHDKLTLKCRQNQIVFQTIAKEEFPTLYDELGEKIHEFSEKELISIFSKITFAVSGDEARPELTGVLVSQKGDYIDFVATDGFRLSLKKMNNKKILGESESMIFPSRVINEVIAQKTADKVTMFVYKKANQVIFEVGDILFVGRIISGEFPNYEKVIPSSHKTQITCDREEFLQNLKVSSIFARESANIVKVKIADGKMKILSRASGVGEGEVVLDVEQEGEDNEIAFNVKFVLDILRSIASKNVILELSSGVEPAVFKTDDDPDFIHIIMPVRVQE